MAEKPPTNGAPAPVDGELARTKVQMAYLFKMAGHSLDDIATRLDYPTGAAAGKAIRDAQAREASEVPAENRTTLLKLTNDRLDYLLSKVWEQIGYGDLKAIDTALKIITTHVRVNQLDAIDTAQYTAQVLVVGGAESSYIERLKALTEGS